MTKRQLLILIPVLVVVLNGLGYLIVSKTRSPQSPAPGPATTVAPSPTPVAAPAPTAAEIAANEARKEAEKEERAQARRAAGLAALEAGDYDKALIHFTEARTLVGDKAQVNDLLRVTEDLRRRPSGPLPRVRASAGGGTGSGPTHRSSSRASRRVAVRDRNDSPDEASQVPAAPPPSGLIIVTTTPRGLLVHVDDAPTDLTPMRAKVKPGLHRIALYDGDRKVYETSIDVKDGMAATVLKDFASDDAADARRGGAPGTSPPPPTGSSPARDDLPRPTPAPAAAAAPAATRAATAASLAGAPPPPAAGAGTGSLEITSPGLYGVVWINGRPRGYPPLEVRDLPPGPAKVEIRVNGVQKRSSTVVVRAGSTTAVKLRSLESAP
jgi:hypothetical protein